MQMHLFLHRLLVLSSCCVLLACQKDLDTGEQGPDLAAAARKARSEQINTFKGPQVRMGEGKGRSWISVNHEGMPIEIGIEMTSEAVESLSTLPEFDEHIEFTLPMHQKAAAFTPFEHMVVDWQPGGHPPPGIFSVPHFDVHFYLISEEERLAIPPYPVAPALFDKLPPAGYMPASYFPDPEGVPQMGKHWTNNSVAPGTFTHTFVYGTYNGEVVLLEPMITLSALEVERRNVAFAQPALYQKQGVWYPTQYNIYKAGDKYYVSLGAFVWSDYK